MNKSKRGLAKFLAGAFLLGSLATGCTIYIKETPKRYRTRIHVIYHKQPFRHPIQYRQNCISCHTYRGLPSRPRISPRIIFSPYKPRPTNPYMINKRPVKPVFNKKPELKQKTKKVQEVKKKVEKKKKVRKTKKKGS